VAYERQHREAVDGLSSAIEKEYESRYGKAVRRVTAVDQLAIALEDARVAA
jgi:hypothetical protein